MADVTLATVDQLPHASYRSLLDCCGSHTAAKGAGTYALGQGDALAISGTGLLSPINIIRIVAADYPTFNGLAAKLRIRGRLFANNTAPTGTYQLALVPVTRPANGGALGLVVFTLGAAVTGSGTNTVSAPAANSSTDLVGSDFALPADGDYALALITTGTVAASAHLHVSAILQMRNG